MGDRTNVAIQIGGKLSAALLDDFIDAVQAERLGFDWMGGGFTEADLRATLEANPGEPLTLVVGESYTDLDDLEPFLTEHGMFYRKTWDAYVGSYNAGGEQLDAEGATAFECPDTDGSPMLSNEEIRELGSWDAVIARLDRLTKPLPAFEIVEAEGQAAAPATLPAAYYAAHPCGDDASLIGRVDRWLATRPAEDRASLLAFIASYTPED